MANEVNEKRIMRYAQSEVAYVALSGRPGEGCANCRFFDAAQDYCAIVESYPADIMPTGWCEQWTQAPLSEDTGELKAVTPEPPIEEPDTKPVEPAPEEPKPIELPAPVEQPKSFVEKIKAVLSRPSTEPAFQVFKAKDNKHYWLARFTNHFEDRDNEILSLKAHERYVARVNLGLVDKPELWTYHTKGTKHGKALEVWLHSGFVFALGEFDDTPAAQKAIQEYRRLKGKVELSHGFTFPKWALKDGVYETYNTFEISTLPKGAASNPFTTFDEVMTMALDDKKAKWIEQLLGKDALALVRNAEAKADKDSDVLKATDTNYKDFADVTETPAEDTAVKAEDYANLLAEMIKAQAELSDENEALRAENKATKEASDNEVKSLKTELAALKEQFAAIQSDLDNRPRSAARATETEIESKSVPDMIKNSAAEFDKFWGAHMKPKG